MNLQLEPLEPPLFAKTGHLQTLAGHFIPSPIVSSFGQKFFFTLSDGDKLVGYYQAGNSQTLVLLLHGLGGSVESDYMRRSYLLSKKLGHHCLTINHRGAHHGHGLAKAPYHSGRGEDLSDILNQLNKSFPKLKKIAIGFSMSGSILLNLITGLRGSCLPDAAITVNAPLDLHSSSVLLKTGFNRLYDLRFVYRLSAEVQKKIADGLIKDNYKIPKLSSVYDFDQIYTSIEGGFSSREDYYEKCSVKSHLHKISVPTVLLTAADDPFINVSDYLNEQLPSQAHLHIEKHGGHMGYISKNPTPLGTRRWLDYFLHQAIHHLT